MKLPKGTFYRCLALDNSLKILELNKKMTQEDVATKCDISRSFYTHIENVIKTSSVEVAKKIASTLGLD